MTKTEKTQTDKTQTLSEMIEHELEGYPDDTSQERHQRLVTMLDMLNKRADELEALLKPKPAKK